MPRFDGTGPMGKGEKSGRGLGNCTTTDSENNKLTYGRGQRQGRGLGQGRGVGKEPLGQGRNTEKKD